MSKLRCYYAHCMSIYNTPQEQRDLEELNKLGFEVVNPNHPGSEEGYQQTGMDYFLDMITDCNVLVFRSLITQEIPAGITKEIAHAQYRGLPIFELPTRVDQRKLDVEQTREYLREVGQR